MTKTTAFETSIVGPLFDLDKPGYFTSAAGYTNARYVPFTDAAKHIYAQIFGILDHFEIEYYVFAGTLVGYVRNGCMPAWMDDIDIMIFEKDIPVFEEKVAPHMLACGFNCRIVGKHHVGGGYHIIALQQDANRNSTIPFSREIQVSVPWAQFDIFFSSVDEQNCIRNLKGWGLYHRKDVPFDWVSPPQEVKMNGMTFTTFANIEDDVRQEYGDVCNELVVKTHNKTFLSAGYMKWDIFDQEFNSFVRAAVSPLTPSLTEVDYLAYVPVDGRKCTPSDNAGFDEIMQRIIGENASAVHLAGVDQIFWVIDVKRLAPDIRLTVEVTSLVAAKRAAHLRQFIDEAIIPGSGLAAEYDAMIAALTDALGSRRFPGARDWKDVS